MILVTGASGYIGSHFFTKLIENNNKCLGFDNFSRSNPDIIEKIKKLTGKKVNFLEGNLNNEKFLEKIFNNNKIKSVIHFAGFKSISESINNPLEYYNCNVVNTIKLLEKMEKHGVKNIIFSSSATVYNPKSKSPLNEDQHVYYPDNPYSQSKYIIEKILKELSRSRNFNVGILRYFNPIGCHSSGIIGENLVHEAGNLIPSIIKVINKSSPTLEIYGNDYLTKDGTGVRDYLHIDDLVEGHIKALAYIKKNRGYHLWNLGSGKGYSVLEIIHAFEKELNYHLPYIFKKRRKGDIDQYWADIGKAKDELNWDSNFKLDQIVKNVLNYTNIYLDKIL